MMKIYAFHDGTDKYLVIARSESEAEEVLKGLFSELSDEISCQEVQLDRARVLMSEHEGYGVFDPGTFGGGS